MAPKRDSQGSGLYAMIKERLHMLMARQGGNLKTQKSPSAETTQKKEKGRGVIKNPEDSDGSQVFELAHYLIERMVSTREKRNKRETLL